VSDILSIAAEDMLASAKWKTVSWRSGTKGRLKARFAAVRVRTADGPPQRIWDKGQQHLPGDEAWLIGEHRASGEKKYYLANLPAEMDLRGLAATIKARWVCEQAHQQLKEELGLDHFEGRSWHGLHRHALMTMIAYAFLQHRRLNPRYQPSATPSSISSFDQTLDDVPTAKSGSVGKSSVSKSAKVVLGRVLIKRSKTGLNHCIWMGGSGTIFPQDRTTPKQHDNDGDFHKNADQLIHTRHDRKMIKRQQTEQISDDGQNILKSQFLVVFRVGFAKVG
jgi:hypothetical protein